ncbi:hypothetical protein [Clostridium sp. ZS2-4]|uniref:hypothetical protein n=1 Tax=Clostridium sp. ZS2-4 TaxID=2987703 RepID=UPI00227B6401|nr:hypothetical protein [Clostridium sp. ZS2-4]MCY6355292.1 hypothetical protein [Clostridium sp. ZS2-4]
MKKILNKKNAICFGIIFSLVAISFITKIIHSKRNKIVNIDTNIVTDLNDKRKLVGFCDNVFVGTVLEKSGDKERDRCPETQFKVKVLENIKGNLQETVTVDQQCGYKDGVFYTTNNDTMIQEGNTYIFCTRFNDKENWYTMPSINGHYLIENDLEKAINKSKETFRKKDVDSVSKDRSNLIEELKDAYKNQIIFDK